MPLIRVIKPFLQGQRYYRQGELLVLSDQVIEGREGYVEFVGVTFKIKAAQLMQKNATDFVRFCMAHQNTFPEGHCPIRVDRMDQMSKCLGWQLKINALKP